MAIKPILFNTEMVRAILDRRKSCTRRIVKGYIPRNAQFGYTTFTPDGAISCRGVFETTGRPGYGEKFFKFPYQPGDILYVRETFAQIAKHIFWYRADNAEYAKNILWKPSIHMPKEAARIWLRVTDVRVERLQDITIDDIRGEGLSSVAVHAGDMEIALKEWKMLWNSTIKKADLDRYGWDANPWVWIIEFERCEKPEGVWNGR